MKTKILNINIPEPLPADYDPLLGKSVSLYYSAVQRISPISKPKNTNISVFDIGDSTYNAPQALEIANAPIPEQIENASVQETDNLNNIEQEIVPATETDDYSEILPSQIEETAEYNAEISQETEVQEIHEELELKELDAPIEAEVQEVQEAQAAQEHEFENLAAIEPEIQAEDSNEINDEIISIEDADTDNSNQLIETSDSSITEPNSQIEETPEISATGLKVLTSQEVSDLLVDEPKNIETPEAQETEEIADQTPIIQEAMVEEKAIENKEKPKRIKKKRPAKQKGKPMPPGLLFGGIFFTGLGLLLLFTSMLAPMGEPFDDIASLSWYWFLISFIGLFFWIGTRRIPSIIIAGLVTLIYLINIVPWMGVAPRGGKINRHTIGFANIENDDKAYTQLLKDAEKYGAEILLIANASRLKSAPEGWNLVATTSQEDPTSLAVISKSDWRVSTQLGEPTIARPSDNWATIIGANPKDPSINKRTSPEREALINRTANRAGMEDGAVLVVGDFAATPWDRAMQDFVKTSGLTRVRCGGFLGTTYSNGLFRVAFDHVFFKNLNVQSCKIGQKLHKSNHSTMFISVAPKGK